MEESTQTPTEETPVSNAPSKDSINMALLCHLLAIFTGIFAPLIFWLIKKDEDEFVAYHGKEALNFVITMAILFVATIIFGIIPFIGLITILVFPLLCLVYLVFLILGTIGASKGQYYKYPVALRLIK